MTEHDPTESTGPTTTGPSHPPATASVPSQGLIIAAVVAVAVALGSVIVLLSAGGSDESATVTVQSTADVAPSTSPVTTSPDTVATLPPDPVNLLKVLGSEAHTTAITRISTDKCDNQYAMMEIDSRAKLFQWTDGEWVDRSELLNVGPEEVPGPVAEIRAVDVTTDGTYEFLVRFDPDPMGMRSYGGVFGARGCSWEWIPIDDGDGGYRFIDGLSMDDGGMLVASGFAGSAGRKTVYVDYDRSLGMFDTYAVDEPEPVPTKWVVGVTCQVDDVWVNGLWHYAKVETTYWSDGSKTTRDLGWPSTRNFYLGAPCA